MHGPHSVFDISHRTVIHCDGGGVSLVDQWKAEKNWSSCNWPITRCFLKRIKVSVIIDHWTKIDLMNQYWRTVQSLSASLPPPSSTNTYKIHWNLYSNVHLMGLRGLMIHCLMNKIADTQTFCFSQVCDHDSPPPSPLPHYTPSHGKSSSSKECYGSLRAGRSPLLNDRINTSEIICGSRKPISNINI